MDSRCYNLDTFLPRKKRVLRDTKQTRWYRNIVISKQAEFAFRTSANLAVAHHGACVTIRARVRSFIRTSAYRLDSCARALSLSRAIEILGECEMIELPLRIYVNVIEESHMGLALALNITLLLLYILFILRATICQIRFSSHSSWRTRHRSRWIRNFECFEAILRRQSLSTTKLRASIDVSR